MPRIPEVRDVSFCVSAFVMQESDRSRSEQP
jgi:hypothetical protein